MKHLIAMAAVGFIGYTIGFKECKYKIQNLLMEVLAEKEKEEENEDAQQ